MTETPDPAGMPLFGNEKLSREDGPAPHSEAGHSRCRMTAPAPAHRRSATDGIPFQGSLDYGSGDDDRQRAPGEEDPCQASGASKPVILQEKFVPRGSTMIIYRATNQATGKIYIGKTIRTLAHAKARHHQRAKFKELYGSNSHLYASIRKHGWDAFTWTIIDQGENDEELQALERAWIAQTGSYRDTSIGYNMTPGGDGGAGRTLSPEQVAAISRRSSGEGNPGYGKFGKAHPAYGHTKTPEGRAAISRAQKGRKVSRETREKQSATRIAMFAEQRQETLRRQDTERRARQEIHKAKRDAGDYRGEKARASKVTDQQRADICRRRASGESYSAIAKDVSLGLTGVRAVARHWGPLNGYPFERIVAKSNHRAKLTSEDRKAIIVRYNAGEAITALAKAYKVGATTIYMTVSDWGPRNGFPYHRRDGGWRTQQSGDIE